MSSFLLYRDVPKVFARFQFNLYISYKTSFSKYYLEINSCPILIIILSRKAERYVVYSRKANSLMASLVKPRVTWFSFENIDMFVGHENCRTKTSFIYTVENIDHILYCFLFSNNYFYDLFIRFELKREITIKILMI